MSYKAPLQDTLFSLVEVQDMASHYRDVIPEAGLDAATIEALLDALGRFAEAELAPLNASADVEGARHQAGVVHAPQGFSAAYQRYVEDGWPRLSQDEQWGGQGLPYSLHIACAEYLQSANMAWCMYSQLNDGAIQTLKAGARPALLQRLLPPLVSGAWTATMCLTEPQAGSDLGLLRSRAEPVGDPQEGRYRITGNKIFISSGDHDLTPNIVHLVLARLPDAPPGVRGISLFVVPKFHVAEDGSLGAPNALQCLSIEHKMGLKGSATCSMAFDGAEGWLLGEPHRGLAQMFVFINKSRLGVAVQAVAQVEAALQRSAAYASERVQGRASPGSGPAEPLVAQPDVRRMLFLQKAVAEGGRALVHECARWVDVARLGDAGQRQQAERMLGLLTPIAKACLSELAFEAVDAGLQVFGGHGYTREWDLEQRLRDVRVTRIYEGTTGIQGADLLGRKVLTDPAALSALTGLITTWCDSAAPPSVAPWADELRRAVAQWHEASDALRQRAATEPAQVGASGVDYVMYAGIIVLGWMWARQAGAALQGKHAARAAAKLATARYYFERLMPRRHLHHALMLADPNTLTQPDAAIF